MSNEMKDWMAALVMVILLVVAFYFGRFVGYRAGEEQTREVIKGWLSRQSEQSVLEHMKCPEGEIQMISCEPDPEKAKP